MYAFIKTCYHQYVLILCLLWLGFSFQAYAISQSALVIDNNQYEVGELSNSAQNARCLAKVLEEKGFEVTLLYDQSLHQMDEAILKFRERLLAKKSIGLFYFSGYGTQVGGKNYLLPRKNARIKDDIDIKHRTIPVDIILEKMRNRYSELNIIILDTTLDTPYLEPRYKNKTGGLASIDVSLGMAVEYATALGATTSHPGLYTKHLIKEIQTGGRIDDVFMRVSDAVKKESLDKQTPWHQESLKQKICFGSCITGLKIENISEQKLNDLEKTFIIWALKRHFRSWEYPIPVHPEFDSEIREKLEQFSCEHGLSPSRFVSSAVISKLKEKNGFSILPLYENTGIFFKGVTAAKLNGRWGLIDIKGNWLRSLTYEKVGGYLDGYLPVMRNGLWGLINHKGVLVQPIRYQKMMNCSEQRCGVKLNDKWGYVDLNRKLIIQPQYDTANKFKGGYAVVEKGGQWLLINLQGHHVRDTFSAKKLYRPSEGLSAFQDDNDKRGFISISGNIVIPSQFESVKRFSEGLAAVYNGKKWGFVDSRGKMKILFNFENVQRFSQKIAPAKDDSGQWGYIDKSGNWIISPRFKLAYPFVNGIATVRVDNPSGENPYRGFINKDGSFFYDPVFEDVFQFREGFAPVKLFGHWGFISKRLIKK